MNVHAVFVDWKQVGHCDSIYDTQLGIELSSGDLHSGTTFPCAVSLPAYIEEEINNAFSQHEAYPVFSLLPAAKKDTARLTVSVSVDGEITRNDIPAIVHAPQAMQEKLIVTGRLALEGNTVTLAWP